MRTRYLTGALVLVATAAGAGAVRQSSDAGPVIRISVELVQLDVGVTHDARRHVTDLEAGDFMIVEGGRVHQATHATYARAGEPSADPVAEESGGPARPPPHGPPRTVALFYDDLGMGFRSSVDARNALRTVVEGLEPTDRVALVTPATWDGVLRLTGARCSRPWGLRSGAWSAGASRASASSLPSSGDRRER